MLRLIPRLLCCFLTVPLLCPQQAAPPVRAEDQCSIEGTALNAITGEPIKKVNVTLRQYSGGDSAFGAITDGAGHFKIENIKPERYILLSARTGFVPQQYGAKSPGQRGTPLVLAAAQNMTDILVKLTPQGVITGRVLDEDGDPLPQVILQCQRPSYIQGRKQWIVMGSVVTNDLGEYRMAGLAPGRYYLGAMQSGVDVPHIPASAIARAGTYEESYVPTYYPSATTTDSAAPLEIAPGAQLRGIDIRLSKTRTVRLRGHVISPAATSKSNRVQVTVIGRESHGLGMLNRAMSQGVDEKGDFEIHRVVPGPYFVVAQIFDGNKQWVARLAVDVGTSNIDGLQMELNPPLDLAGRVMMENKAEGNVAGLQVMLTPKVAGAFSGGGNTQTKSDGSFTINNLGLDSYVVTVFGLKDNFYIKAIRYGDADVTDSGVDFSQGAPGGELTILISPAGGQVDGKVENDKSEPAVGATVVLIPAPEKRSNPRLYRAAMTSPGGTFTLKGIPPGEYKLFAWEQVDNSAYQNPEFLKPFESRGEPVGIAENGHETKQLKSIPE